MRTVDGKNRTREQKEHDRKLLAVCQDIKQKGFHHLCRASDWVPQVGSKEGPIRAYVMHGRTQVRWDIVVKQRSNFAALYSQLERDHPGVVAGIPQ